MGARDVKRGVRSLPLDMANPVMQAAMAYATEVGVRERHRATAIEKRLRGDMQAAKQAWVAYYTSEAKCEELVRELDAIVRREQRKPT